jgi:hypothetical protein
MKFAPARAPPRKENGSPRKAIRGEPRVSRPELSCPGPDVLKIRGSRFPGNATAASVRPKRSGLGSSHPESGRHRRGCCDASTCLLTHLYLINHGKINESK